MAQNVMYNPEFVKRVMAKRRMARARTARKQSEALVTQWRSSPAVEADALAEQAMAIMEKVAATWGMTTTDITGESREQGTFNARVDAMITVKRALPAMTLPQMGQVFRRHHTTVMYVLRRYGGIGAPYRPRKEVTKSFTIRLSAEYRAHLKEMSAECGMPMATLVRSLVEAVVDDERANAGGRYLRVAK